MSAMSKVRIYSTRFCGYCFAAKALFDRKGVAYEELDASDPAVRQDMIQRAMGQRTVPQIFVGDRHIGGYDEVAALDRRGQLDPLLA
jgi:glutaredoxin 3